MNVNRYLKSHGVIFVKDCSEQNLKYLIDLGAIPVLQWYFDGKRFHKWLVGFDMNSTVFVAKRRPIDVRTFKMFLKKTELLLNSNVNITNIYDLLHWVTDSINYIYLHEY